MAGKTTLWLAKSGGQIIGPYADRQVTDLLRNRLLVPLDEVAEPCDRWRYIRDVPQFAKVVEEIRVRHIRGVSDNTTTHGEDASNLTKTMTITQQPDDLTEDIVQIKPQTVQDILFHSIDDHSVPKSQSSAEVFTHEGDLFVRQKAQDMSKWIWALTVVVIFTALSFVVFRQFIAKPIQNKVALDESVTAGIESLESGEYQQALNHFKLAHSLDPNDDSIYLYLGILKVQIEEEPFEGRKLLEKLLSQGDKDIKRVLTGIGLAFLKEGEPKAAESNFNRALDFDPLFKPALINLGAAAISTQEWEKASNHLQLALKEGSEDGAEILMLTEVLIRLYQKDREKQYLVEALKYLKNFSNQSQNYFLESRIGEAYIAALLGEKNNVYAEIDRILDLDALETDSHRQHLFINRSIANWNLVSQWCLRLSHDLDPNSHVIAFEALCLMKSGDFVEANRKIDDALAQSPKDPLVLATYAFILQGINSMDKAAVAVDKALENDKEKKYAQPRLLKAKICQTKEDVQCAGRYWRELIERNPKALAALAGMAQVSLANDNLAEAKKYLKRGLQISTHYRPFFHINKTISQTEDRSKARGL